ncbi:leucine aminopeptidase [Zychaea mexicana]|uniref:leucine aminopeptidase n=1 Tax=Zychaea mexicana TaxID=64656 RepID=UPI0022FE5B91|nr:leucine aminopeptidase [Zychaea mexicana]KAI9498667.1 leucine aminopeptidase [Zychaea mexicana]
MRVLPAIASALALLSAASVQAAPLDERGPPAHALSKQLTNRVKIEGLLRHTDAWQKIADEGGDDNRVFGSKAHNATIDYIYNFNKENGYETTLQFAASEQKGYHHRGTDKNASTPEGGVTGDLASTGNLGCTAADYGDVTGKIALVQRGTCSFGEKAAAAGEAGAAGLLIYNTEDGELNGTLGEVLEGSAPTGGISKADGEALAELVAGSTPVSVLLNLVEIHENRTSANVCAETKTGNKNNVVMLGAHTDSVVAGPGINDNGSGSAGLLEVSYLFRNVKPNNAVRFCYWTAEEFVGAEYYVSQLSQEERDNIALYLNFDMIASPNYFNGIYDGDGSAFDIPGPEGSAAIENLLENYFASQGAKSSPTEFNGRSDYGPFIDVGIPAGGTFTGAEGLKTAEEAEWYGGEAGVAYDECYHQACDTNNNLNNEAFVLHTKAIAHAVATYSYSTEDVNGVVSGKPGNRPGRGPKNKMAANKGERAACGSKPRSSQ